MSRAATEWAAKQRPPHPPDKLVLWSVADAANRETGEAFPSVAAVVAFTGYDRKAVMRSLDRLSRGGWIIDTGRRVGATKQVKVWRLATGTIPQSKANDPGTVPERDC